MSNPCGYYNHGWCKAAKCDCDQVPADKCLSMNELLELARKW